MPDAERDAHAAYRAARAMEVVATIAAEVAVAAYTALQDSRSDEARVAAYAHMLAAGSERSRRRADVQAALSRIASIRAGAAAVQALPAERGSP